MQKKKVGAGRVGARHLGRLQRLRTLKWAARAPVLAHQLASGYKKSLTFSQQESATTGGAGGMRKAP